MAKKLADAIGKGEVSTINAWLKHTGHEKEINAEIDKWVEGEYVGTSAETKQGLLRDICNFLEVKPPKTSTWNGYIERRRAAKETE